MNISIKIILFVFITTFFGACEKDLNIKIDDKYVSPLLVLNARLVEGDSIIVNLSSTVSVFDNSGPSFISDAKIQLYDNGNLVGDLIPMNQGYYYSTLTCAIGHTYKFTCSYQSLPAIEASTTIPDPAHITIVKVERMLASEVWGHKANITFRINDDGNIKNYYKLGRLDTGVNSLSFYNSYTTSDVALSSSDGFISEGNYQVDEFNDDLFNGENREFTVSTAENSIPVNGAPNKAFYFQIYSLDENNFKYTKSYRKYLENNSNPFTEPTQVYSNVKNGLGAVISENPYKVLIQ